MCVSTETWINSIIYCKFTFIPQASYDIFTIIMIKYGTIYIYTNTYKYNI